jgi:serine phosphatase RsbU (regulator of sigma subunit)
MEMPIYQEKCFVTIAIILVGLAMYLFYKLFKRITRQEKKLLELKIRENTLQLREEKEKLEVQKYLVETAKRSLTDSIRYAQRIQAAIIPTISELKGIFKDIFVLFQPRDVISGDFYWYAKKNDVVFFAAVDCTGHGVPGAFMSLIGYAMLEQLVNVKNVDGKEQTSRLMM